MHDTAARYQPGPVGPIPHLRASWCACRCGFYLQFLSATTSTFTLEAPPEFSSYIVQATAILWVLCSTAFFG
jgi:hypothetical protein